MGNPLDGAVGEPRGKDSSFPDGVTMHHFDGKDGDGDLYYVARSPIQFEVIGDMGLR